MKLVFSVCISMLSLQCLSKETCTSVSLTLTQRSPVEKQLARICADDPFDLYYSEGAPLAKLQLHRGLRPKVRPALGNPMFQICEQVGGKPELVTIATPKGEVASNLCQFYGDHFVSGSSLMKILFDE